VLEQGRIHWLVQTSLPAPMMRLQVVMKSGQFLESFKHHHFLFL
jgi:hypothetical protein